MKRWLLGLLAMFVVHSLLAESVVGIRADGSTKVFAFADVVSVKASENGMLTMNETDEKKSAGFSTLKFRKNGAGLHSVLADDGIRIYPNPVSSMLFVKVPQARRKLQSWMPREKSCYGKKGRL